jgi:hypothetical protein
LGHSQSWGPQGPEKRLGNNATDDNEGGQDEPNPAIERKSILAGHETLQPLHLANNVDKLKLIANGGMMVRAEGLEPPQLAPLEPKSSASTNSATPARGGPGGT